MPPALRRQSNVLPKVSLSRISQTQPNGFAAVEAASAYAEAVRIQIGAASVIHSEIAQREFLPSSP